MYTRNSKHGVLREPMTRCSACMVTEWERCETKKRKQDEEDIDLLGDPTELDQLISIEHFMALLHEKALAGVFSCSAHVSTQGLDGNTDEMCKVIVGHVWEATGFHFTYAWFPLEGKWLMLILFN